MKSGKSKCFMAFATVLLICASSAWALTVTEEAKLLATDGASRDNFGYSVAIDGDTALIGAFHRDNSKGAVYVFTRNDSTWVREAELLAPDGASYDQFGFRVALSGDTAVIGAEGNEGDGSAYVYTRDIYGIWTLQAKLKASDGEGNNYFGSAVAIVGDTALVCAKYSNQERPSIGSGAVYVYTRDIYGRWTEEVRLVGSVRSTFDWFGEGEIAFDGGTALVGAYGSDVNGTDTGVVFVFSRDANGTWTEQAKLVASDGVANDQFGWSVAIDGDTALVGAYQTDDRGTDSGSTYVFTKDTNC